MPYLLFGCLDPPRVLVNLSYTPRVHVLIAALVTLMLLVFHFFDGWCDKNGANILTVPKCIPFFIKALIRALEFFSVHITIRGFFVLSYLTPYVLSSIMIRSWYQHCEQNEENTLDQK
jgi:hypothetical protein